MAELRHATSILHCRGGSESRPGSGTADLQRAGLRQTAPKAGTIAAQQLSRLTRLV